MGIDDTADRQSADRLKLRPPVGEDLDWMVEMACSPALLGEHNWSGQPPDEVTVRRELEEGLANDSLVGSTSGTLIVELLDGTRIGDVSWRTERWGPSPKSRCRAFGIALHPEFRGQGYGTEAQRLLIDYLFANDDDLHRVQSDTAVDNRAEKRAFEKLGLTIEGVVRDAEYRDGTYHDHVLVSVLRSEWEERRRNAATPDDTSGS